MAWVLENRHRTRFATAIQTQARAWRGRVNGRAALQTARVEAEKANLTVVWFVAICKRHRRRLLCESAYGDHTGNGVVQHIFRTYSTRAFSKKAKKGSDKDAVLPAVDRIDNTSFALLMKDTPDVIDPPYFGLSDVDLIFARCKADPHDRHVDYKGFVQALDVINASLFADTFAYEECKGRKARMVELVYVTTVPPLLAAAAAPVLPSTPPPPLSPLPLHTYYSYYSYCYGAGTPIDSSSPFPFATTLPLGTTTSSTCRWGAGSRGAST